MSGVKHINDEDKVVHLAKQLLVFLFVFTMISCKPDQPQENANTPEVEALLPPAEDYETSEDAWGYIDLTGALVIADQFDEARAFSEGLALVRKHGQWGYVNNRGEMQIPCSFRSAWPFKEGLARVQNTEGLFGYISSKGDWAIKPTWEEATNFKNGLACVRITDKYGFIDINGTLVIQAEYDRSSNFDDGYAVVKKGNKYGMIDNKGELVLPFDYQRLKPFSDGLARASQANKYGFLNEAAEWVIEPQFIQATSFKDNFSAVFDGQKWGLMDKEANWKINPNYDQLFWVGKSRWVVEVNSRYQLINEDGAILVGDLDEIHPFSENLAPYKKGELWGYLNMDGKFVTPALFYLNWPYHNGMARVATEYGLTYIDTTGYFVLPPNPNHVEIHEFNEGLAAVQIYDR